jgi:Rrf2 family protein
MFDSSRRLKTAIEAVVYIALNSAAGPVHSRELTRYQGIAPRYLEPVLQRLGRAGIVDGIRGPRGGYRLARERRRISVGEIVRTVLEVGDTAPRPATGGALGRTIVEPFWGGREEAFLAALDKVSVDDLCRAAIEAGLAPSPDQPIDFAI